MAATATLSSKFQISVPKEVREKEKWAPGQKLAFVPTGAGIMLVAVPELSDIMGSLPNADRTGYRDREDRY
jgi:AbrB family looped-hinge helix DNA binding protein